MPGIPVINLSQISTGLSLLNSFFPTKTASHTLRDYAKIGLFGLTAGTCELVKDIEEGDYITAPMRAGLVTIVACWAAYRTDTNPYYLAGASVILNAATGEGSHSFLHAGAKGFMAFAANDIIDKLEKGVQKAGVALIPKMKLG